jgi:precorrin-3B synthase
MSVATDMRRGWCPSVARPMPSGDGLLVRLSLPADSVPPALLHAIASCARRFGNGFVDLTRRGNLQLRGLSEETIPGLIEALSSFEGVAPPHEAESARDIMMSPLSGLDPKAVCDVRPIVKALRERLARETSLRALPAKFCFTVEDGGDFGLDHVAADIRFKARGTADDFSFTIALGGREGEAKPVGTCAPSSVPESAVALAFAFLELRGANEDAPRRMAELLKRIGTETLLRSAGLTSRLWHCPEMVKGAASSALPEPGKPIIMLFGREDDPACFGVAVPFGQITADELDDLASHIEAFGGEVRLTPWRVIFVANKSATKALETLFRLRGSAGLITQMPDPRLNIAACPGKPACARGTVSPREDALLLGRVAQGLCLNSPGLIGLHISGCAKGCARSTATKATLVGRNGRYDLVIDGTANDPPMREGLTLEEAKIALEQIVEEIRAKRRLDPEREEHL